MQGYAMFDQELNSEQQHISAIFQRLCEVYQVTNNTELEQALALTQGYSKKCIQSAIVPYEVIDKASKHAQVSFDYLLSGKKDNLIKLEGPLLQAINNGLLKSIKKMSIAGLIKGENQTQDALKQLADIQVKQIKNELKLQSQIK